MRCGRNSRSTFHPGQANTKIYDINILAHFWVSITKNLNFNSSKFAALGLHKGFTKELSVLGKDGIKTTCLCPCKEAHGWDTLQSKTDHYAIPSSMFSLVEIILPERALVALEKIMSIKFDVKTRMTQSIKFSEVFQILDHVQSFF
ncbi:hypothetical protein E2320_007496 [Naja naja]|nr:hypothetical protein E2320_007496 [Naja naja]